MKCANCGGELPRGKRRSARTCSDRCRKALSRRKDDVLRHVDSVRAGLWALGSDLKKYPELREMINTELAGIDREVHHLRRLYPDDDMKALAGMLYDHARKRDTGDGHSLLQKSVTEISVTDC
jgi:hypothetical protein